jgi:hypothetical protein
MISEHHIITTQFRRIDEIRLVLLKSDDQRTIFNSIKQTDIIFSDIKEVVVSVYRNMNVIQWLCIFNLTFFLQQIVSFLFTKKMNRFYYFPSLFHLSDLTLFISSLYIVFWIRTIALEDVSSAPKIAIDPQF